ncbi:MAG: glycosyltransferase, partial [Propionibacterium sp.]
MHVDHLIFAASADGYRADAEKLATALGAEHKDGGFHPRFGTRNHIIPLADARYIEIVEVLDHPAADKAPFGQAVRARSEMGGGWLGWAVVVPDIGVYEERLGRLSVPGSRHFPDGRLLEWKQLGIRGMMADPQLPMFQ